MGIIGACLPVMRQPLKQHFPRLFGSSKNNKGPSKYYSDDRFTDQYVLQNVSNRAKDGSWNISVSGPDLFRSGQRKSDELGIIREGLEGDRESSGDMDGGSSISQHHHGIRKNVVVSVDRR